MLIALHGASQVNNGPNKIALHTASISEAKLADKASVSFPRTRLLRFAETPLHQETYLRKYRERKDKIMALFHTQLDVQQDVYTGKAPHLWITKAMRLSDPLVYLMMWNLGLDVKRMDKQHSHRNK